MMAPNFSCMESDPGVDVYLLPCDEEGLPKFVDECEVMAQYAGSQDTTVYRSGMNADAVLAVRNDSIITPLFAFPADSLSSRIRNLGKSDCGLYTLTLCAYGVYDVGHGGHAKPSHYVLFTGSRAAISKIWRQFRNLHLEERIDQNREAVRQVREAGGELDATED